MGIYSDDPLTADVAPRKRPHGPQEYKGNGKHDWEVVVYDCDLRLRVPGGWLYRRRGEDGMTFVPVPNVVGYAV